MDRVKEAKNIAFDRVGSGEKVLLISGFPQTRWSWNKIVPLLSAKFETIAADLPSFGNSAILAAPATTENVARISRVWFDHRLAAHVVAHDFGAWVAYSWALLFKDDFKSLTLIDAGIPRGDSDQGHSALRLQAQMELHFSDAPRFAGCADRGRGRLICRLVV